MPISDKTIDAIQDAVATRILTDSAGDEYVTRPVFNFPVKTETQPVALCVATLAGLVDYISATEENKDGHLQGRFLQIASYKDVRLLTALHGEAAQRSLLVMALHAEIMPAAFKLGSFIDHEAFVIGLQVAFVPTEERDTLLRVFGRLGGQEVRESEDDGISQSVSVRSGVVRNSLVNVPNPVVLRPYRTFPEIEQPSSPFVLRVRRVEDELPEIALFEADGGKWKLDAIASIRAYLAARLMSLKSAPSVIA
jgi:hypothetical protein